MKPMLALLATLNGVDAGMTLVAVRLGAAHEVNPVMKVLLDVHPGVFLAVKVVLGVGCVLAATRAGYGTTREWTPRIIIGGVTLGYLALVVYTVAALCSHWP